MQLRDMVLMRYISEERSLAAAGARAGLSAPAVTSRLHRIEENVGMKLVFRGSGSEFGLTPAGRVFLKSAELIIAEMDRLNQQMTTHREVAAGTLRIMCVDSLMIDDLPFVLDELMSAAPMLSIIVKDGDFGAVTDGVLSGDVDVGLLPYAPPTPGGQIIQYKLDRICILTPKDHPLASKPGRIFFRDALGHDFVGLDRTKRMSTFMDSMAAFEGSSMRCRLRVSSLEAQAAIIAQTRLGIGATIESIAHRAARSMPVKMIPLADDWATLSFHLLVRNIDEMNLHGREFVRLIKKRFARD